MEPHANTRHGARLDSGSLAHGAEVVSYFRWRQLPYAQEQMHSGLHLPNRELDQGGLEARQVARELTQLPAARTQRAPVALVLDYESLWIYQIQPQGTDFQYQELVFQYYSALRTWGLDVDILSANDDLLPYAAVIVPSMATINEALADKLSQHPGQVLLGPRSGSKTAHFAIPSMLPPGPVQAHLPIRVERVESLRPGATIAVHKENPSGPLVGQASRWRDEVQVLPEADPQMLKVHASFTDGLPAHLQYGRLHYVAAWLDQGLSAVLQTVLETAGIPVRPLPGGLRLRNHGHLCMAINYGPEAACAPIPPGKELLLGQILLQVGEVAIWDTGTARV